MKIKKGFTYNEKDVENTKGLLKLLAGTGVLSLGAGATYYGIKKLIDANYRRKLQKELSPVPLIQEAHNAQQIYVPNELLALNKEGSVSDTAMSVAAFPVKAVGNGLAYMGGQIGGTIVSEGVNTAKDKSVSGLEALSNWALGLKDTSNIRKEDLSRIRDSEKSGISGTDKLIASLSAYPNLKPLWAIPAGVGLAYGGYYAGKGLMKKLKKMLFKEKDPEIEYAEKAREIYEDSAKYFKDTVDEVSGKSSNKSVKKAEVASDGNSYGFGLTNPFTYAGLLGAGLLARQIKQFKKGYDTAGKEISDSTRMLRAWQAVNEDRSPDYLTNLEIALEAEPADSDEALKSILKKEQKLMASNKRASYTGRYKVKPLL